MLLFCLARPDLRDACAAWSGDEITLQPLTLEESDELIESLLGDAELDAATRSRIRDVAEGNPLFFEQLLAMIADGAPPDEVPATKTSVRGRVRARASSHFRTCQATSSGVPAASAVLYSPSARA